MPRKTEDSVAFVAVIGTASMRPRPDAAENLEQLGLQGTLEAVLQ